MRLLPLLLLVLPLALACDGTAAGVADLASCERDGSCASGDDAVYVVGSSYSWDALPPFLDGRPSWHIFCARPLDFIFNFPYAHCVGDSTPWPEVLDPPATPFAYVSFQPVKGAGITLEQDVSHIGYWLADQPKSTTAVIHATWPLPASWESELHDPAPDHTLTNYSLDYGYVLVEELELEHPQRRFVLTRSNEMMDYIFHDPQAPFGFAELFRDTSGHMSELGSYLQHNALRQATNQEIGVDNSAYGLDPLLLDYLDEVILLHPPD